MRLHGESGYRALQGGEVVDPAGIHGLSQLIHLERQMSAAKSIPESNRGDFSLLNTPGDAAPEQLVEHR